MFATTGCQKSEEKLYKSYICSQDSSNPMPNIEIPATIPKKFKLTKLLNILSG